MKYKQIKIGDIVDLSQGLAINSKTSHVLVDSGLPLLRITDLINGTKTQFVNPSKVSEKVIAKYEDVIFTRTGQVGLVFTHKEGVLHNNSFKVIPKNETLDKGYLYWFLSQKSVYEYVNSIASGSVQKDLNHDSFKSIDFILPELATQKKISNILWSIQNKIELNNQMNETLEAMAKAIFKEWFIDFGPVKAKMEGKKPYGMDDETAALFPDSFEESELGMIPRGWRVTQINELAETISETYKFGEKEKIIFLNTGDIQNGEFLHSQYSDIHGLPGQAKKRIRRNDILFSEIRPENKRFAFVNFDSDEYVVSTKLMVLRSKNIDPLFLYFYLTRQELVDELQRLAEARSGTFPQITFDVLGNLSLVLSGEDLLQKFYILLRPLYEKKFQIIAENKRLAEVRDLLLPRLISGEIQLKEISLD